MGFSGLIVVSFAVLCMLAILFHDFAFNGQNYEVCAKIHLYSAQWQTNEGLGSVMSSTPAPKAWNRTHFLRHAKVLFFRQSVVLIVNRVKQGTL
jgi:hypothetical protein